HRLRDSLPVEGVDYSEVLIGSLGPGTTERQDSKVVRTRRDEIQVEIGRHLTWEDGFFTANIGESLQLLVTVAKSALIHAMLQRKQLTDLGADGAVSRGVARYLAILTNRWARDLTKADDTTGRFLAYLHGGQAVDRSLRRARILQVSDALLQH